MDVGTWSTTSFTMSSTCLIFFLLLDLFLDSTDSASQSEIDKHLELGRDFLSRGQLQDALSHYHAAVEGDPNNYLTYFKRGTVYLALGKSKFALNDLDKVLALKPDFTSARLKRGQIHLKQAQLDDAAKDFKDVLKSEPHNDEAIEGTLKIEPTRQDIALVHAYIRGDDHPAAIELLTQIIEVCPWSAELRELRAESHVAQGDILSAINDIRTTTKLRSDYTDGYFRLSNLLYQLGEVNNALKEVRECLKLDPEHKDCFPFYKKIKKVDKLLNEMNQASSSNAYSTCTEVANKVLRAEPETAQVQFLAKEKLCHCLLLSLQETSQAITACKEALEIKRDARILCDLAEAYINAEMYDDAVHYYQEAIELEPSLTRAKEGQQKAQKLQKQAERRDYYKILDVKRTATKKEIVKAYRKAAQKWHPDNFQGDQKKIAEKKFIDIAAAKEVLTDEEKRRKFDNGDDPLDPESQQEHGFPFHQHFHHGSPFQFKFHFN